MPTPFRRMLWSLLALLPLAAPVLADDRADLDKAIAAMNEAVRAGDKAAYLKHVDLCDPEFAVEQQHWADDLDRHKPLEFEISIKDEAEDPADDPVFKGERAQVRLQMKYRMSVGHAALERGKRATWPAVFVKKSGRWLYAGEDWLQTCGTYGEKEKGTAGRFTVRYFAGSDRTAEQVLEAFPIAKAHDDEGFEVNITRPLQIKLYQSMEHLKAWVYLSMPDEVLGGWNEPGESIKFMANYSPDMRRWRSAFAHEYGHVATWELGPKIKSAPWWLAEGVAELAAEYFVEDKEHVHNEMIRLHGLGKLCRWEEISDYDTAEPKVKKMAYLQGHDMVGYVSERWGRKARNLWIRRVAQGRTLDEATREALGVSFADLDKAWRETLKAGESEKGK